MNRIRFALSLLLLSPAFAWPQSRVASSSPAQTVHRIGAGLNTVGLSASQPLARRSAAPFFAVPTTPDLQFQSTHGLTALGACSPTTVWPWTVRFAPGEQSVFISHFGGYSGSGGCAIGVYDAHSLAWQATIPVGESPEEIVCVTHPGGALKNGFVTNSSGSSVTVFDANHQPVATVPIPVRPTSPWGTAFPYGMAVAPDQQTVWVGTGEGRVFAIDCNTLALDPSRTLDFGPDYGFGRITFAGDKLILPTTQFQASGAGASGLVMGLDPNFPGSQWSIPLASATGIGLYPSPQDIAIHQDGRAFVAGFDMGNKVYVIQTQAGILLDEWNTLTQPAAGKFQALGLQGHFLVVVDHWSGDLARINTRTGAVAGVLDASVYGQGANEVTFHPSAPEVWIPMAGSSRVVRLGIQ